MGGTERGGRGRRALLLLVCFLVLLLLRWPSYLEPPERDIATYAVIGRELNLGRTLYDDLWDHKPPPVYWAYAVAHRIAGEGPLELLLVWLLGAFACVAGVERAARRLGGGEAGRWSALLLTFTTADLFLQANQPNTELLVNATLAWGVALLPGLGDDPYGSPPAASVAAGVLLGLAVLTKPVAVFPAAAVCLAWAVLRFRRSHRAALPSLAALAAGAVLPTLLTGTYFAGTSRSGILLETLWRYNSWYASSLSANLAAGLRRGLLLPLAARTPVALLVVAATATLCRRRNTGWWIAAAWLGGTPLAVAAPGRFYPHYYQLWLPVLALFGGLGLACLPLRPVPRRALAWAALAAVAALQLPALVLPPADWSRAKYGDVFLEAQETARRMGPVVRPGDWIFVWGDEPEIYWFTHTRPASGVLSLTPMTTGPLADDLTARALAGLERHPPRLVILHRVELDPSRTAHPVFEWIGRRYRPAPAVLQSPGFVVLLPRTAGAAAQRSTR